MSKVYLMGADSQVQPLLRLKCKDESVELQNLLERNPLLLPSEQIAPENPPQWLLIKREMPVDDPATGSPRWSIDFLYVDHLAIPTLVECKRCNDTRSRREVIAQMLEYAANGHHYWTAADLQGHAQQAAGGAQQLDAWISRHCGAGVTATAFFESVIANLRESTMRLIFFLEESPNELRSLVDFLNRQMKATEVLIVEARLYDSPAGRVVVPWLFGYTEEARVAKRESRIHSAQRNQDIGGEAFRVAIESAQLPAEVCAGMALLLDSWPSDGELDRAVQWVYRVNAILMVPTHQKTRGLLHLGRNGDIQLYFGYWDQLTYPDVSASAQAFKDKLADRLAKQLDIRFTEKQLRGFPTIKASQWAGRARGLIATIDSLID